MVHPPPTPPQLPGGVSRSASTQTHIFGQSVAYVRAMDGPGPERGRGRGRGRSRSRTGVGSRGRGLGRSRSRGRGRGRSRGDGPCIINGSSLDGAAAVSCAIDSATVHCACRRIGIDGGIQVRHMKTWLLCDPTTDVIETTQRIRGLKSRRKAARAHGYWLWCRGSLRLWSYELEISFGG